MKEMLNNLAEGEIEFYQSVRHLISFDVKLTSTFVGDGRVGANYTYYSTYTSGRLVLIYIVSFAATHVAGKLLHGLRWSSAFKLVLRGRVQSTVITSVEAERFLIYIGFLPSFPF